MRAALLLPLTFLFACSSSGNDQKSGTQAPGENFSYDYTTRITSPANGAVVDTTFTVTYETGADVVDVRFEIDGATVTDTDTLDAANHTVVLTVEEGSRVINLIGLDASGNSLSNAPVRVTAQRGDPWVLISSPIDGDNVSNPVNFAVDGHSDLDRIEIAADGYLIGILEPGDLLNYEFTGTGTARAITATGYLDDEAVAVDNITITVEPGTEPVASEFTDIMVSLLESYPTDGTNGYYWPAESEWLGTTQDIWYRSELVAEGDPDGRCFCVGLTWEVFMRAFQEADAMTGGDGTLNGMTVDDLTEFRIDWFIRDLNGDGNIAALENYGLGEEVTDWQDAQPGDVVQFWRHSGSGHNNIFISWERDSNDAITGLTYWSTQGSTDGIGYNTEYFGTTGSDINPSLLFLARPYMPTDWLPW